MKTNEKPYTFIVGGKKVEMTREEINALPKVIEAKEKEVLQLKMIHTQGKNTISVDSARNLERYFSNVNNHLILFARSGVRLKRIAVLLHREFSPSFFVRVELEFNADKSFKSLHLSEWEPQQSKQAVHWQKQGAFRTKEIAMIRTDKEFKRKCKRVVEIISENYVQRNQPNFERCNTILKGWIAELF